MAGTLSDEDIIARVGDGDIEAFGILVKKYENFIYTLIRGMVLSEDSAKDISQEAFLRAYRALRRFEKKSSFKTWLYRIAHNTALNYIKRNKIPSAAQEIEPDAPLDSGENIPLRMTIRRLIDRLKPEHKVIIMLHYFDDLKYEEIAQVLNCPVGTVKIRLFRAKHELKTLWEKYAV
ncbi:MAG: hypothetical protein A2W25_16615 [candidate division Zixibacteria bacterium RBG_16_53_22]|nr:MAG: hypothetical protein A2W25_16615 [candidate division Zixibacteria bacterium RBG_16_53_22]